MKLHCSKQELFLVGLACLLGFLFRARHTERLAVEHFDEGVYAAGLWYDSAFGKPYPLRHLYAPPLLPETIELLAAVPGLGRIAPFLPAIILGSCTVFVVWWLARLWFGANAGLFIVFVAALSDYHILFSRMALTDVPALLWICLAVGISSVGLQRASVRFMAVAGVCTGLAWWTKYTGWLPLAITASGSALWWCLAGRRTHPLLQVIWLVMVMIGAAVLVWTPWYWILSTEGGYGQVAANHAAYFTGLRSWQNNMADHLVYHIRFDSWLGAISITLGMLAAGTRRWIELARSTWNQTSSEAGTAAADGRVVRFPPPQLLVWFSAAAVLLGVIATGISSAGLLACVGIGGMAGIFLWPTLSDLYQRSTCDDLSPPCPGGVSYQRADLSAAAAVDPLIGACFVVAWFLGMFVMTPMYHPFPRLSLPLLAATWLAAAAGIAWWMEARINVVRRGEAAAVTRRAGAVQRAATGLLLVALILTLARTGGIHAPAIWQNRTSLRDASWHLAATVLQDVAGEYRRENAVLNTNGNGIISPEHEDGAMDADGRPFQPQDTFSYLQSLLAAPFDTSVPLTDGQPPSAVVYGFGEPAVLGHLRNAGLDAAPIQDLSFGPARLNERALPTYLVLGPNALRTPGLLNDWAVAQYRFEHVTDFYFAPGDVVLYNLFSPVWIAEHVEARVQKLELYRLRD